MRRTISSALTFFMKFVFPSVWIGGFGLATCALWFDAFHNRNGPPEPEFVKWAFLAVWLGGSGFILRFCSRIKRVQMDNEALYVSNYCSESRIPFTEVSHFTEIHWPSGTPTVTIHLRALSPYGEHVVFVSKFRWNPLGTHPIVSELQTLCDRASGKDGLLSDKKGMESGSPTP